MQVSGNLWFLKHHKHCTIAQIHVICPPVFHSQGDIAARQTFREKVLREFLAVSYCLDLNFYHVEVLQTQLFVHSISQQCKQQVLQLQWLHAEYWLGCQA